MERTTAEQAQEEVRRILAQLVDSDYTRSGITRSALALATDIPRETLRRKMLRGDLTVPELYRIAPLVGGNVLTWIAHLDSRLNEVSE